MVELVKAHQGIYSQWLSLRLVHIKGFSRLRLNVSLTALNQPFLNDFSSNLRYVWYLENVVNKLKVKWSEGSQKISSDSLDSLGIKESQNHQSCSPAYLPTERGWLLLSLSLGVRLGLLGTVLVPFSELLDIPLDITPVIYWTEICYNKPTNCFISFNSVVGCDGVCCEERKPSKLSSLKNSPKSYHQTFKLKSQVAAKPKICQNKKVLLLYAITRRTRTQAQTNPSYKTLSSIIPLVNLETLI